MASNKSTNTLRPASPRNISRTRDRVLPTLPKLQSIYSFDRSKHLFPEKVISILFSKWTVLFGLSGYSLLPITYKIFPDSELFLLSSSIVCSIVLTPLYVLWCCSVNHDAFRIIIKSFDFWMKSGFAIIWAVTYSLYALHFGLIRFDHFDDIWDVLSCFFVMDSVLRTVLIVLFMASMDAVPQMKGQWKITASVIVGITLWWFAFNWFFFKTEWSLYVPFSDSYVSITLLLSGYQQIIGMFLLKQGFTTWRSEGRFLAIQNPPWVEWEDDHDDDRSNGVTVDFEDTLNDDDGDDTVNKSYKSSTTPIDVQQALEEMAGGELNGLEERHHSMRVSPMAIDNVLVELAERTQSDINTVDRARVLIFEAMNTGISPSAAIALIDEV